MVYLEYLGEGNVALNQLDANQCAEVREFIGQSVGEMTEYLVDMDRARNEPLPVEEWELASDLRTCRHCNFVELCRDELGASPFDVPKRDMGNEA
jgi:hypothetical protein